MAWINYERSVTVGQRVRVYNRGHVGVPETTCYQRVTKITATQVTLDNGNRYVLATGERVGGGERIIRMYVTA